MIKIKLEVAFVRFHHEEYEVFGSELLNKNMPEELARDIERAVEQSENLKDLTMEEEREIWEDIEKAFEELYEVDFTEGHCVSIAIGRQWYRAKVNGFLWFSGFEKVDGWQYPRMTEERFQEYENWGKEEPGPFGGAFSSWADYIAWRNSNLV